MKKIFVLFTFLLLAGCEQLFNVYVDSYGVEMVFVPAGKFLMGADASQLTEDSDAFSLRSVYMEPFFIDKYEVSNADYQKCVDAGICQPIDYPENVTAYFYPDPDEFENLPVFFATLEKAQAYCEWRGARLPTEIEWEKAARGTDGRIYPWGNSEPDCSLANYGLLICSGFHKPVDCCPLGVSPYGAYNMAGNVAEWTTLCEVKGYKIKCYRDRGVLRGGSLISPAFEIRTFERVQNLISSRSLVDGGYTWNGIRCAKSR